MEINLKDILSLYLSKKTKAASLAVFRILFGLLMCFSTLRFWYYGWIEKLYLNPSFHFHYSGFEWVQVPGIYTYLLFIISGVSALCVALGLKYRLSIIVFFLSFSYIELMDKTTYLNHYYFVSIISFMLIWLPAHAAYSIDAIRNPKLSSKYVARWTVDALKVMLCIVYIHAGLAKLNIDWMVHALPLSIWLSSKADAPLIGGILHKSWVHYLFSWGGALYDLSIVFFLLWSRTRLWAYATVILFHLVTWILFPIGMFPWIMIAATFIFFNSSTHENILDNVFSTLHLPISQNSHLAKSSHKPIKSYGFIILSVFLLFQMVFPLRHLLLTDNVFWTEQGYRFSWRVMLMEKTGYANFKIVDSISQKRFYVQNDDFLNTMQEKQMSTQPDFILEYGQYLGHHFSNQGHQNVAVYVESNVSLNGRPSQVFINPDVDLMQLDYNSLCTHHIIPLKDAQ